MLINNLNLPPNFMSNLYLASSIFLQRHISRYFSYKNYSQLCKARFHGRNLLFDILVFRGFRRDSRTGRSKFLTRNIVLSYPDRMLNTWKIIALNWNNFFIYKIITCLTFVPSKLVIFPLLLPPLGQLVIKHPSVK